MRCDLESSTKTGRNLTRKRAGLWQRLKVGSAVVGVKQQQVSACCCTSHIASAVAPGASASGTSQGIAAKLGLAGSQAAAACQGNAAAFGSAVAVHGGAVQVHPGAVCKDGAARLLQDRPRWEWAGREGGVESVMPAGGGCTGCQCSSSRGLTCGCGSA